MSEAQAKAIIREMTGYRVDDKPALALEMAQRLGQDLLDAVAALGGVPPVVPLEHGGSPQ